MRYCKRTFFNKLFQPRRIGKPIFRKAYRGVGALNRQRPYQFYFAHWAYRPRRIMLESRRGKTPKNQIIGRHALIKSHNLRINGKLFKVRIGARQPSIFVRKARLNVS